MKTYTISNKDGGNPKYSRRRKAKRSYKIEDDQANLISLDLPV